MLVIVQFLPANSLAVLTASSAESPRSLPTLILMEGFFKVNSESICLPMSAWLPERRTTRGILRSTN